MRGRNQTSSMGGPTDDEPNLGTIGRALWKNKGRIVGPTLIIAAAAFIAVNLMTPKYKSEARVLVEGRENIFLRPEAEKTSNDRGMIDQEAVTSQVQLVLSRDLGRDIVKSLSLTDLPEFSAPTELSFGAVLRMIGLGSDAAGSSAEERTLSAYFERLSAYSVDKSRVIAIEFKSADPDLAARGANAISEGYLVMQQMAKQDQARSAGQWLSGELEKLREKVSEAEAKVEAFRAKSNLFVGSNNSSLSGQQLTEVNTQLSSLRAQKSDAEAKAKLIRDTLRSGQSIESSEIVNSDLIRRLAEQRVILRTQMAEQSSTLLPQHPRIKELRAQIADLEQQIRVEGERLVRTLEADAKIAGARLSTLTTSLDQLKGQAALTGDQDVQLRALEREAKAQRDLFESYLGRYREASARDSIAAAPADARIISRAVVSNTPFFPKKMPIVLIASLATLCLSSAFVTTGALLSGTADRRAAVPRPAGARTRASDRNDVALAFEAAAVAPVVEARRSPDVPAMAAPPAKSFAPALRAADPAEAAGLVDEIAAGLLQAGEAGRRICVIGSARDVGTTMTAIALARSLSRNARVVLVDLAFSSPNLDVIANNPKAPGIADLVAGKASFSDVITRDQFSRAHVVAAGKLKGDRSQLVASHMFASAMDALAQSYNHLVIDAGAQTEIEIDAIAKLAPRALVMAGEGPEAAAQALRSQMLAKGFADVTVLTGPPAPLDHASTQSAAA